MLRERQTIWRRLNLLGDLILTALALGVIFLIFMPELDTEVSGLILVAVLLIWAIFLYGPTGSYFYRMKSSGRILKELTWALSKSYLSLVALIFFVKIYFPAVALLAFFALNFALLTTFRFILFGLLKDYRKRGKSNRNVLIIGTGKTARAIADRVIDNKSWGMRILGFLDYNRTGLWRYRDIPLMGHPDGLSAIIAENQLDYLIIAVENGDLPLTRHAFAIAEEMGVTVCLMSDFYYHPISRASSTAFMDFPAVVYSSQPADKVQLSFKEAMDWLGGLMGLLLAIPIGLIAALAIKIEDGGPIFFRQVRSGKNGKPFIMYKFRTMVRDAENLKTRLDGKNEMTGPVFKIKDDPRVTRVGRFLRKTSIDEIPQFINIIRREMSLVGPRPPLPNEVRQYDRWQRRKLSVRPGLTCLWQINGRNRIDFEEWMKLDLEYIDNWSIWLDTKILLKTVPAVLKTDGAS